MAPGVGPAGVVVNTKETAQDALQVAIQGDGVMPEGEAGDGGCCIRPHAGQLQQLCRRGGQLPAQVLDDMASGPMEVAGASIVAQPFPGFEYLIQPSCGQSLHRGEVV